MGVTGKAVQTRVGDGLSPLKRQFDQWRAGRKVGARIPLELWAGAVAAAVEYGAYRVAAELHLDYAVLKRRAAQVGGGTAPSTELAPQFVELFAPAGPTRAAVASPPECVVEVANARGAKMRVELNGSGLASLAGLCSAFWSEA
jgi:hypothetical protein